MIEILLYIVGLFWLSVLFHELGHLITLIYYKRKIPKISFENFMICIGENKDYYSLNKKERIIVYFNGILSGLFVILFFIVSKETLFIFVVPLYLWGCRPDVNNIIRVIADE